jgi:hypothetical protein
VQDPGKIVADLAVTLALGGDCLADIAMLRAEPRLFGPVASDPVVSRLVSGLAADARQVRQRCTVLGLIGVDAAWCPVLWRGPPGGASIGLLRAWPGRLGCLLLSGLRIL